jgi:hypothetical protein
MEVKKVGARPWGVSLMRHSRGLESEQSDALPWPWPAPVTEPTLVVFPPWALWAAFLSAYDIYQVAYQRAVISSRPSRYEMALAALGN